jgi:pimeloyl-ACP methyl ester carboxylesterase
MRAPLISLSLLSGLMIACSTITAAQAPAPSPAPAAQNSVAADAPLFHPTRFFVTVTGSGPDVILIPGLGSSHDVWKDEVAKLSPHYRLYLVQVYGFAGYKPGPNATGPFLQPITDELAQYIESNHLRQPAVIGHSLGGLIALMLATQHPADVSKLMVVDALPFLGLLYNNKNTVDNVRAQALDEKMELMDEPGPTFLHSENAEIAALVTSPDNRKLVLFWTANSDRHVFADAVYEDMITDVRPQLAKITAPVTVLFAGGGKDTEKLYSTAYSTTPHLKLVKVEDSLHFIMLDQPKKFDEAVQEFLKG